MSDSKSGRPGNDKEFVVIATDKFTGQEVIIGVLASSERVAIYYAKKQLLRVGDEPDFYTYQVYRIN